MRRTGRPGAWLRSRWIQRLACAAVLAALPAGWMAAGPAPPARAGTPQTVVSLTFDDADADQMTAAQIMHDSGVHGTFYIITSAIGNPTYMSLGDLHTLAAYGDEIGDHTVSHLSMPKVSLAEARRQICGGKNVLTGWGFKVRSFAYPDARYTPAVEHVVRQCGLDSARIGNGLLNGQCETCGPAETTPPADPYAVRTPGQIDTTWSVRTMENAVVNAEENGGGWIPFVFHHICSDPNAGACGNLSISPAHFRQFIKWLARHQKHAARVETVGNVIGGRVHRDVPAAAAGAHGVQNTSLSSVGSAVSVSTATNSTNDVTGPACWMYGGYGQNAVQWQRVPGGHDTRYAERVTMTSRGSGDAKLLQQFDLGQCSLPVAPGQSYQLSAWYESTAHTQFALYYRVASGRWLYWTSSSYFAASHRWKRAQWRTPPAPADASGMSFGLDLGSVGSLTTSDYTFQQAPINFGVLAFRIIVVLVVLAIAVRVVYSRRSSIARGIRSGLGGIGRFGRPGRPAGPVNRKPDEEQGKERDGDEPDGADGDSVAPGDPPTRELWPTSVQPTAVSPTGRSTASRTWVARTEVAPTGAGPHSARAGGARRPGHPPGRR